MCRDYFQILLRNTVSATVLDALTLRIWLFHIAEDGPPTIVYMDVLDADNLLTLTTVT